MWRVWHEACLAAAKRGDLEAVQRHFELPDIIANVAEWNAFHRAKRLGHPRNNEDIMYRPSEYNWPGRVTRLLQHGAAVNYISVTHDSPLLHAVRSGDIHSVYQLVLEGFADVDVRSDVGRTPLMIVVSGISNLDVGSSTQILDFLVDCGADLHAVDSRKSSALHYAMCASTTECARFFLVHGVDPNCRDAHGRTPLISLMLYARENIRGRIKDLLDMI